MSTCFCCPSWPPWVALVRNQPWIVNLLPGVASCRSEIQNWLPTIWWLTLLMQGDDHLICKESGWTPVLFSGICPSIHGELEAEGTIGMNGHRSQGGFPCEKTPLFMNKWYWQRICCSQLYNQSPRVLCHQIANTPQMMNPLKLLQR